MKRIYNIIGVALTLLSFASCKETINDILGNVPDMEGVAVTFTTDLRSPRPSTRAAFADKDAMDAELGSYKAINENYDLTISMFKKGSDEVVASSKYSPTAATNNATANGFDSKGILSLQYEQKPMYWPDNVNEYGFKATCGTPTVEADQSDWTKFIAQDALLGYAYGASYGDGADDIEAMNYHTNKDWYKLNKERLEGDDKATTEDFQRIPLYLRHQRSWLTIILKAGNGVKREFLQEGNKGNLVTTLFSHSDSKVTIDKPLTSYTSIHYDADINGGTGDVQTTKYDAIVEPYDYSSNLETEICKVVVNNMKFTYYASNDDNYGKGNADLSAYNLTAGKHLTITATLSTDRVVQITAMLEDWDEMEFTSICDDYGQNGDPIKIPDVKTLKAFLDDPMQNKAGNTAIISAASLTLPDDWSNEYDLEASLNLAGATIYTKKQFLNKVGHNSTVVNGVIALQESTDQGSALCSENHGIVQQVTITSDGNAKATKAAVCDVNYGTIFNCTSDLAVQGASEYVGGIAAKSMWSTSDNATQPIIDKCVVNGRVGAVNSDAVFGVGGIAGYAEGRLTNNTFNYGITITYQNSEKYKNIVAATSANNDKKLGSHAYNNAWPTVIANELAGDNANTIAQYAAVLDCQAELETLVKLGSNATDKKYRVAADFDVDNTWDYGKTEAFDQTPGAKNWSESDPIYNHTFILDGNNHTISTHGKMLFSHIKGEVKNLTIYCEESIAEDPNATSTNVIAPLAYSVNGATAKLTNVKVRMADEKYIQASQPSGLVCCAFDGAVISNCEVEVKLHSKMKHDDDSNKEGGEGNDSRRYMGAIAAFAVEAEIVECKVHSGTKMFEVLEDGQEKHTNLYCGGLVGGTTRKNEKNPSLLIHECYSWCQSDDSGLRFGAIIGRTVFTKENKQTNGMREGCQGNWWQSGNPSGDDLGTNFAKILGKKNSVEPGSDYEWWK